MTPEPQKKDIAEESVPMRVICCVLAVIAISCSFIFGKAPVPVVDFGAMDLAINLLSIWLCIGGCMFSYHYRHNFPPQVERGLKIAAICILVNLARELWMSNLHSQQFEFLYPLVNALTATSIVSCFELRTRKDIIATSAFGLALMALAGCSGRSIIFGGCVLLYIVLGGVLLCLCARSYAMGLSGGDVRIVQSSTRGHYLPALILSVLMLPCASVAAFSFMPRADSLADQIATQVRSLVTTFIYQHRMDRPRDLGLSLANPNHKAKKRKPKPPSLNESDDKTKGDQQPQPPKLPALPWPLSAEKPKDAPTTEAASKHSNPKAGATAIKQGVKPPMVAPPQPKNLAMSSGAIKGIPPLDVAGKSSQVNPAEDRSIPKLDVPNNPAPISATQKLAASPSVAKPSAASTPPAANTPPAASTPSAANRPPAPSTASPSKTPAKSGKLHAQQPGKNSKPKTTGSDGGKPAPDNKSASSPPPGSVRPQPIAPDRASKPPSARPASKNIPDGLTGITSDSSVSLERRLQKTERPIFSLACNRSVYVKLLCLDSFDGHAWHRTDAAGAWETAGMERGVDLKPCPFLEMSKALPVMELAENFEIKSDVGEFVPTSGIPQHLSLLSAVSVDQYGNVTADPSLKPGAKYTAICYLPSVSVQHMRDTPSYADGDDHYLERYLILPENESDDVGDLADELCRRGVNRFTQAESIVSYLRKNYKYTDEALSGDEKTNLADEFLFERKQGDCKAFATAFIVLCRSAGIPARFVAGFLPGDVDPVSGASTVKAKHAHAWAEIYMEPYGWVSFDPTPGGLLPARAEQKYYNYDEFKRDLEQNANTSIGRVLSNVEVGLQYAGYVILAVAAAGGLFAAWFTIRMLRDILREMRKHRKFKHPAMRFRKRVMKGLSKLGITGEPSDTGRDVIAKLERALEMTAQTPEDPEEFQTTVEDFFETYNAVVFGKADEMTRLKAITTSIELQLKR
ncbi:MAG TPA: transglutaminase domain-containing protein [Candidatus Obscuribacterales bacterium]